ncbi:MAG: chemotaxis protein CheD [Rubrivivax sp.]|jgi:chemotaxis protein CheD|nr:chemotaxis protein CheD [Rubrivivax sp.]
MAEVTRSRPQTAARHYDTPWAVAGRPGQQVVLLPGQMNFGAEASSLRTLLGSCVAITLWHPARRLGGMCHFLLPQRPRKAGDPLDGRYGDEAVYAMVQCIRGARTDPSEYHAHLYGGADTMPEGTNLRFNVGERNIEQGWSLIDRYGFQLQGVDVGEDIPRTVTLHLASGEVEMKRGQGRAPVHAVPGAARPA